MPLRGVPPGRPLTAPDAAPALCSQTARWAYWKRLRSPCHRLQESAGTRPCRCRTLWLQQPRDRKPPSPRQHLRAALVPGSGFPNADWCQGAPTRWSGDRYHRRAAAAGRGRRLTVKVPRPGLSCDPCHAAATCPREAVQRGARRHGKAGNGSSGREQHRVECRCGQPYSSASWSASVAPACSLALWSAACRELSSAAALCRC